MNWQNFWQDYPVRMNDLDPFQQVGKTVNGTAISPEQYECLLNDILTKLNLSKKDNLLDLCCGNGLITSSLSQHVQKTVGIDFSAPLIQNANQNNLSENVEYILSDVKNLSEYEIKYEQKFDKVLCYEALAFFDEDDLKGLLLDLKKIISPDATVLIASVLDKGCKSNFYNTWRRKIKGLILKLKRSDPGLGKWWDMKKFKSIATSSGYLCTVLNQNCFLHTAHYRKDIVLNLKNDK
tara:strand:+ start:2824 stop:3534 length:711 start_codon:yes stop_codon:yes gene_type:complete